MKNIFLSGFIGLLLFSACQQKKEQGEWKLVWEENFNEQKLDTTIWSMIPRGGGWATYMASYPELYQFTDTTIRLMAVRNTEIRKTLQLILQAVYGADTKKNLSLVE